MRHLALERELRKLIRIEGNLGAQNKEFQFQAVEALTRISALHATPASHQTSK